MTMQLWLALTSLALVATSATAAIQDSDFWFHNEGQAIFINGAKGAPLHIDYIGPALTKSLKVRITPTNPALKVNPSICTFTKKDDNCRLTVHLSKAKEKVYGIHQFEVTEIGSQSGDANSQAQIATTDTGTVSFGVGVQGKDMPKPIVWGSFVTEAIPSDKVIITNATRQLRLYQSDISVQHDNDTVSPIDFEIKTKTIALPSKQSCYMDYSMAPSGYDDKYLFYYMSGKVVFEPANYRFVSDITDASDPIFNGAYQTGDTNITTCSAMGLNGCASDKWASWVIGQANLGAKDIEGGLKAGEVQTLRDNSWESNTGSRNSWIYYKTSWNNNNLAILLIQGSTDGSPFDARAAAPSILEIQSAPPCSYYLQVDPNVVYSVSAQVFGPGTITMPAGGQCQKYSTPGLDFTHCTGGGYQNSWYEITAVPDAGKTFKGWYSSGLCDDASATCRFQLTRDVTLSPTFQ